MSEGAPEMRPLFGIDTEGEEKRRDWMGVDGGTGIEGVIYGSWAGFEDDGRRGRTELSIDSGCQLACAKCAGAGAVGCGQAYVRGSRLRLSRSLPSRISCRFRALNYRAISPLARPRLCTMI